MRLVKETKYFTPPFCNHYKHFFTTSSTVKKLLLFISFFIFSYLSAQDLRFQHYNYKDGLSHYRIPSSAKAMQDQQGFIWIPTFNGLNRFDGRHFKVFRYDRTNLNSLSTNLTTSLCEDDNRKIWIALVYKGLNIFNPKTNTFETVPENICTKIVHHIAKDKKGDIWIFNKDSKAICRCQKGTMTFEHLNPEDKFEVFAFLDTEDDNKWFGAIEGVVRYREQEKTFELFNPYPKIGNSPFENRIKFMTAMPNGEFWISSQQDSYYIFNPKTEIFKPFPTSITSLIDEAPNALFLDKDETLWMGHQAQIMAYDLKKDKAKIFQHQPTETHSLSPGVPIQFLQDEVGSLWSFTIGEGISITHHLKNPFINLPTQLHKELTLLLDDQHLLISTKEGLLSYHTPTNQFVPSILPPTLPSINPSWMRLSATGVLWWLDSQQKKVFSFHLKTGQQRNIDISSRFELDAKGNCWFFKAFYYYDVQEEALVSYKKDILQQDSSLQHNSINWLSIDDKNKVWVGIKQGFLVSYEPTSNKTQIYKHDPDKLNSLNKGEITRVFVGRNGWIYIRTDTGLSVYQPRQNKFQNLTEKDGMPSTQFVAYMEDDDGHFWLATTKGLSKLKIPDLTFQNFDESDGLPYGNFDWGQAKDRLGNIYFRKNQHFFRFHPDSLVVKTLIKPVVLTDLMVNNQIIAVDDSTGLLQNQIHFQKS